MCEIEQRDVLMSRVIDGCASGDDWRALRDAAEADPGVWCELEKLQGMQSSLCAGVAEAIAVADEVELPAPAQQTMSARLRQAGAWGGWLAAAAVLLAWSVGAPMASDGSASTSTAGLGPNFVRIDSPDDALRTYVDRGREEGTVVGLVPQPRVVETRALPDGSGVEVYFVREILERQRVEQAYQWSIDEAGNYRPVRVKVMTTSGPTF